MLEVVGSSVEFDDLEGVSVLGVPRFGLTRSSRLVKRTMDIVGSTFVLLLALPALLVIALAVKLDSRGPMLFRQRRIGREGRPFEMLKFRTMVRTRRRRRTSCGTATRPTACSRSPTTRASPASGGCSGPPAWTSCPSCSTCSAAR